jgi:beta-lactamase class A
VSLREVLRRMIVVSSNEATNMAVELVGLDAVREALAVCGAPSSKMERLFGDLEGLARG